MNVRRWQILTILLSSLLVIGCGTNPKSIPVTVTAVQRAPLVLPPVEELTMQEVEWWIISDQIADLVFEDIINTGEDPVLFGLTDQGYKRLGLNQAKILLFIRQQQAIIDAYKEYYIKEEELTNGGDN